MNTKILALCAASCLALAGSTLRADDQARPQQPAHSPEFERMKALVGTWTGKTDMGDGPMEVTVHYRMLSGGSVIEERIFEGTPHEMVTMYFDQGGKLALTHYCILGNRPAMLLKSSDAKTMTFDLDKTCGINPKTEAHMHSMSITFDDADTLTMRCTPYFDGEAKPETPTTLKRVKA